MIGQAMKFPGVFFQDYTQTSEVNPPNGSKEKLLSAMEKIKYIFLPLLFPSQVLMTAWEAY